MPALSSTRAYRLIGQMPNPVAPRAVRVASARSRSMMPENAGS
jgi:hypothetical protein